MLGIFFTALLLIARMWISYLSSHFFLFPNMFLSVAKQLYPAQFIFSEIKQIIHNVLCLNIFSQPKLDSEFFWLACNVMGKSTSRFRRKQTLIYGDIGDRFVTSYAIRNGSVLSLWYQWKFVVLKVYWSGWAQGESQKYKNFSKTVCAHGLLKKNKISHFLSQDISE